MMIYIFMIILSLSFCFIATNLRNQTKKGNRRIIFYYHLFCFLSFLPPFIVSGLRNYSIGTDTSKTYLQIYNTISNGGHIRDIGYGLINKICALLFNNYTSVLLVSSLLIIGLSFYTIYKESEKPLMSVLLFFSTNVFFISMNMVRQCIAVSIFIFSIQFIKNRKMLKYIICILIACLIHSSSIIYLPLYFLYNIRLERKKVISIVCIATVFSSFVSRFLIMFLLKIDYFRKYFAWYLNSAYNKGNISLISLLISALILIYLIYIYNNAKNYKDYKILLLCEMIAFCMLILSAHIPLMQRFSWSFSFPLFVYLPNTFKYVKNGFIKSLFKYGINCGYLLYMIFTIFVMGYNAVIPYTSIFS